MGRFSVGDVNIVQMLPHASAQTLRSKWATRGWTYQEGYLSPRRLVFTDNQVSYLCNAMHCAETIRKPQNLPQSEEDFDISGFIEIIPNASSLWGTRNEDKEERWLQLKQKQLPNYSQRELRNTSDSIDAVLGLFRALEPSGIRHLYGIPVSKLSQSGAYGFAVSLAWHHEAFAERCHSFPSWSWAGWKGGICMSEPDIHDADGYDIALVDEDGYAVHLRDWFRNEMQNPNSTSTSAPRVLRISAMTVWVNFEERSWDALNEKSGMQSRILGMRFINGTHAVLPICENVTAMPYAYMDENAPLDTGALGVVFQPKRHNRRHTILLLRRAGKHYQRIGLVRVSGCRFTRPATAGNSDPQMVYVDSEGTTRYDESAWGGETPIWLQGAIKKTITIV